jgi:hypothetical protein
MNRNALPRRTKPRRIPLVVALVWLTAGCGESIAECCQDDEALASIRGLILDQLGRPKTGVTVTAVGLKEENCREGPWGIGRLGSAQSDGNGQFVMTLVLPLVPPGRYCADLVSSRTTSADTIRNVEFTAVAEAHPRDTTQVTVRVNW